jgi:hypothetical protein
VNAEQVCFILDDNAYIIASSRFEHEGEFFGAVDRKLMRILIDDGVYNTITVYDYQAVCYQDRMIKYNAIMEVVSSAGSILIWNPLKTLWAGLVALVTSFGQFFAADAATREYLPNCELKLTAFSNSNSTLHYFSLQ